MSMIRQSNIVIVFCCRSMDVRTGTWMLMRTMRPNLMLMIAWASVCCAAMIVASCATMLMRSLRVCIVRNPCRIKRISTGNFGRGKQCSLRPTSAAAPRWRSMSSPTSRPRAIRPERHSLEPQYCPFDALRLARQVEVQNQWIA